MASGPGTGSGNIGNKRLASKRLSYPDWVRANGETEVVPSSQGVPVLSFRINSLTEDVVSSSEKSSEISLTDEFATVEFFEVLPSTSSELSESIEKAITERLDVDESVSVEVSITEESSRLLNILSFRDKGLTLSESVEASVSEVIDASQSFSSEISLTEEFSVTEYIESVTSQSVEDYLAAIGGKVTLSGNPVEGVEVKIIRESDNEVVRAPLTDGDGNYRVTVEGGPVYHVVTQYNDGSTFYNAESLPFIDTSEPGGEIEP